MRRPRRARRGLAFLIAVFISLLYILLYARLRRLTRAGLERAPPMQTEAAREAKGEGASLRPPGATSALAAATHASSRLSVRRMPLMASSRRWIS